MRMPRRAPTRRVRGSTTILGAPMPYEGKAWRLADQLSSQVPRTTEMPRQTKEYAPDIAPERYELVRVLERDRKRGRPLDRRRGKPQRTAKLFRLSGEAG